MKILAFQIQAIPQADCLFWAVKSDTAVDYLLASKLPIVKEACIRVWGFYKDAVYCSHPLLE